MYLNLRFSKKSIIASLLLAFVFLISFIAAPYADALNAGSGSKELSFSGYRYLNSTQIQVWADKNIGSTFYTGQFKIYEGTDPGTGRQIDVAGVAGGGGSNVTGISGLSGGGSVIITSAEPFVPGHVYTIVVTSTLKSNNNMTLGHYNNHEDVAFSFAAPDTQATPNVNGTYSPSVAPVVNFYPLNNATNVPVERVISFSLNVPMDNATATAFSNWAARTSTLVLKKNGQPLIYDYSLDTSKDGDVYAPIVSDDRTFVFFPMTGGGASYSYNFDFNASYTLDIPDIHLVNGQTIPAQTITFTTAPDDVPAPFTVAPTASITGNDLIIAWQSINAVAGVPPQPPVVSPAATGYNVWASTDRYFNFVKLNSTPIPAPTTSYVVTGLQPSTPYYFRVTAVNGSVEGGFSPDVLATTPADTAAPVWPDDGALTALPSGGEVALSWPAASDNASVTGYLVYQDTTQLTTVTGTTYTVTGLSTGSYNFSVIAVDAAGNTSTPLTASVTIDTVPPTWPEGSSLRAENVTQTGLTLIWTAASDNVGVTCYQIYENGSVISTVYGATSCNINGLTAGTTYNFRVEAGDAAGNWSTDGPAVSITTPAAVVPDTAPPAWPGNSSITVTGLSDSGMTLTWSPATDNVGVVAYNICQDGSVIGTVYSPQTTCTLTGLSSNTSYTFRVQAGDAAGNWSTSGPAITVKTLRGIASGDTSITVDNSNKNLAITASTPDSVTVIVPNGINDASISVINLLGADGSGNVTSRALPALNITAGATINSAPVQITVTVPAGTTVSAPAGWDGTINMPTVQTATQELAGAVASSGTVSAVIEIGYGDVPLTFSQPVRILIPGQAGKGVGYYRDGIFTKINPISGDSAAALGANSDGYVSVGSDLVVWTKHFTQFVTYTPTGSGGTGGGGGSSGGDIQAPTWPNKTFKTATKAGQTVILEWYPATDNVGVTKYRIYHGTEQIGEVDGNTTKFTYTAPSGSGTGSLPYSVQAGDAAGNWSTDGPSVTLGGSNLPLIVEYGVYSYDPGSNTTPPTPVGSVLTSGTLTGVPTTFSGNTAIGIRFATNVATSSYFSNNQRAFQLLDASGSSVSIKVDRSGDGTPSDVNRNYLFVIPQVALKSGSSYKIIIGPDLTSNNGMSAGVQQEIEFTTAGSAESPGVSGPVTTSGPTITTGSASVDPSTGATVGLGDNARIVIPANALKGTSSVTVTVKEVTSPPAVPSGYKIAGKVYEFTVGDQAGYTFNTKVGITLSFDPSALSSGETPAIFYYDEAKGQWVNLGGTVSGNTITVEVDHLTKFAVFAVKKTAAPVVQPGTLTDIVGHWAEADIKKLVGLGAVSGYPDGTFKPDSIITRAEFATVLVKAFKLDLRTARLFKDTAGHWAKDYISTAAVFGIVNGYDADTFGPDDPITREQMAVMIVKAAKLELVNEETKFADGAGISEWARSAVATAVKNGIIKGYTDNTFRPQDNATRAEAATVIMNALNLNK